MSKNQGTVIVTEEPARVVVQGSYGGGYSKPSSVCELIKDTASALVYALYGQRPVKLIAPVWIREQLVKQGFAV